MRRRTSLLKRSCHGRWGYLCRRAGRTRPGRRLGRQLDSTGGVEGSITVGGANPGDRAASVVQVSNAEYAFAGTFNATEKDGAVETDAS